MRYEVQENYLFGGWTNAWSYENEQGEEVPSIFDTKKEAEEELEYFFKECEEAVACGNMTDVPSREDFRIVEVV